MNRILGVTGIILVSVAGMSVAQADQCTRNGICVGAQVEILNSAGNNVDRVIDVQGDNVLVQNENNSGTGWANAFNLRVLPPGQPVLAGCFGRLCVGQIVSVIAPGTGDRQVQIIQLFTNGTATVQGTRTGETSTFTFSKLVGGEVVPPPYNEGIRAGDQVEILNSAGNNVDRVVSVYGDQATVLNENNGGEGTASIYMLRRLAPGMQIQGCSVRLCEGTIVRPLRPGKGDTQMRVLAVYSNQTAQLQGIHTGELATFTLSALYY